MASSIENEFEKGCDYVTAQHSKLNSELLVRLYGYFKQATIGKCDAPKPSIFDLRSQAKWKSWSKLGDMSKSEAMQQYIQNLTETVQDWNQEIDCAKSKEQCWVSVSTMCKEKEVPHSSKDVFDWVKEGCISKLKEFGKLSADLRDDQGLTLLHWAADRGHADVVKYLVKELKIDPNCRDNENQTPLHYAAACGHLDICKVLLDMGDRKSVV